MENSDKYSKELESGSFLKKAQKVARSAGLKTTYSALLLYYSLIKRETPVYAKNIIIGVLGYLLAPFDAIPDLTPILGFTDDIGVLSFGLVTLACYINDDVRIQARKKLKAWFGEFNLEDLAEVDAKL